MIILIYRVLNLYQRCFQPIDSKQDRCGLNNDVFERATAVVKQHSVVKVFHSITRGIVISMSWLQSSCINHYLVLVMLRACLNLAQHGLAMCYYREELERVAIADIPAAASVWR